MHGQTFLFFKLTLLIGRSLAKHCDRMQTVRVREGNFGQSADFNWLGVLNVHLPEWGKLHIATTGIVLIKINYALANAGDVVKIPQNIFKTNSKAMFLEAQNTPWFVKPASYVTHPEYDDSTLNSIAVVKLNLDEVNYFPLTPICLPAADTFHASSLYLTGFTDDNEMLEKLIYKIQHLDKEVCEEYYNRTMMPSEKLTPSAYLCGFAPNTVAQCVWENGMVLVSNATGYFALIGFGIYGPGCMAPARFIDLFPYFSWIKSVTSPDEVYDQAGYRRKEDANKLIPNIPIHELYTMNGSRRHGVYYHSFEKYPFEPEKLKFHLIEPTLDDENTLLIIPFDDLWQEYKESCSQPSMLMYKEVFELTTKPAMTGTAIYKLALYDKALATCSCVRLTVDCEERSKAMLAFKEEFHPKENTGMSDITGMESNVKTNHSWDTPEELYRYFPVHERIQKPETKIKFHEDKHISQPESIKDSVFSSRIVMNYDLYIKFNFKARATLKFEMFAKPFNRSVSWVLPNITESKTTPNITDPNITPNITDPKTMPNITDPKITPNITDPNITLNITDPKITPNITDPKITPNITDPKITPNITDPKITPNITDPNITPNNTEPKITPNITKPITKPNNTEPGTGSQVSAARSKGPPGAVVMVCWLVSACLKRMFVIY